MKLRIWEGSNDPVGGMLWEHENINRFGRVPCTGETVIFKDIVYFVVTVETVLDDRDPTVWVRVRAI